MDAPSTPSFPSLTPGALFSTLCVDAALEGAPTRRPFIPPTNGYVVTLVFKGGTTVRLDPVYVSYERAQARAYLLEAEIEGAALRGGLVAVLGIAKLVIDVVEIVP